jgi:broad specificity phosphatase PhoE
MSLTRLQRFFRLILTSALLWSGLSLGFSGVRAAEQDQASLVRAIKTPGAVVMIRHAQTEPGLGDPENFRLSDCSTQRNLSQDGRQQSVRLGQWFSSQGLQPQRVLSSQWCRCLETARLAFSSQAAVQPFPALNSFFQGHGDRQAQLREARAHAAARLQRAERGFEVWVTHQVTISALTGVYLAMGELVVAMPDRSGQFRVLAQGRLAD